MISDVYDVMGMDIIDFNRLNGHWKNSADALRTISSRMINLAIVTKMVITNYNDAPELNNFPGWDHCGNHPEEGRRYWNWFYWNHPSGELTFSDAPDFFGYFEDGARFLGDIGKVSASTFSMALTEMRRNDVWITVNGDYHTIIEYQVDMSDLLLKFSYTPRKLRNKYTQLKLEQVV